MPTTSLTADDKSRCKPNPSVLTALKTPRILTREVLAGLVVALALIPEAISFSIIAGVDPRMGLFASFVMAVSIAVLESPRWGAWLESYATTEGGTGIIRASFTDPHGQTLRPCVPPEGLEPSL